MSQVEATYGGAGRSGEKTQVPPFPNIFDQADPEFEIYCFIRPAFHTSSTRLKLDLTDAALRHFIDTGVGLHLRNTLYAFGPPARYRWS